MKPVTDAAAVGLLLLFINFNQSVVMGCFFMNQGVFSLFHSTVKVLDNSLRQIDSAGHLASEIVFVL